MALMFPRLAQNFARNGYYPTDDVTLEQLLNALTPDTTTGTIRILDPCAGEGVAITEIACHLGETRAQACTVEYDGERAAHCATLADVTLYGDLMDTVISQQAFSLLFLNPPYGDQVRDEQGSDKKGRARLEKLFYQRTVGSLQYDGILVLIIPNYTLDKEFAGWLANSFTDIRAFCAATDRFKQLVIFGRRVRQHQQDRDGVRETQRQLTAVGMDYDLAPPLPDFRDTPYQVPVTRQPLKHFYRITLEPEQLVDDILQVKGLWPSFSTLLSIAPETPRPPAKRLSRWHLALALAAGVITGVITSSSGRTLIVRGDTRKEKSQKVEFSEDENGDITETTTLTDRFVPAISAWDMTPDSETFGQLIAIR